MPLLSWQQMCAHAQDCLPEECCGLLGGRFGPNGLHIELVVPVTNIMHSPVRFRMEPQAQLRALQDVDARGWELAGIFHSHPAGPPHPSETDIAEFAYPGVAMIILTPAPAQTNWQAQAFWIFEQVVESIPWEVSARV
jgi:proteasome lid subunit RPN8/RPN11